VALSLDRKAFIGILQQGKGDIGATMLPPPEGLWGMPPEMLATLPGYDPDVAKHRTEARKIMEKLGYGPDKRLALTLSSRNIPGYRQPAVILIDQLKEIYIDAVLEPVETANWFPKIYRKDYSILQRLSDGGRLARQVARTHRRYARRRAPGRAPQGVETDDGKSSELGGRGRVVGEPTRVRAGPCPEAWRHFANAVRGQPGEHVDPRGIDDRGPGADDGGVQQPRHVRPARKAKQPAVDRPGPRHELVVERGGDDVDIYAARRCEVA
jgi:hypothetical protein